MLAETLRDPDEIWLVWQEVASGAPVLRRRYLRVLPGPEHGFGVFELGRTGWREITAFHITAAIAQKHGYRDARDYIESQRLGVRIYAREDGA